MHTTLDKLLNGRIEVEQPAKGFRIAVDTLLLAAAVPARAGQRALDLGCGVGGAMIALARRVEGLSVAGLELQESLAALCKTNIARNNLADRLSVLCADLCNVPEVQPDWRGAFDHVLANPPYHDGARHGASANTLKRIANTESAEAALPEWIARAAWCLEGHGMFTMIHRADRQEEIIALLCEHFSSVAVKPLWSKADGTCKRAIFYGRMGESQSKTLSPPSPLLSSPTSLAEARKREGGRRSGIQGGMGASDCKGTDRVPPVEVVHLPPLVLYGPDGRYSPAAHAILRDAEGMGE